MRARTSSILGWVHPGMKFSFRLLEWFHPGMKGTKQFYPGPLDKCIEVHPRTRKSIVFTWIFHSRMNFRPGAENQNEIILRRTHFSSEIMLTLTGKWPDTEMKVIQGQNHSCKQGLNCKTNHEPSYQEKYWLRISAGQNVCIQPICLTPFLGFKVVSLNKINLKVGATHFYRGCQFIPSIFFYTRDLLPTLALLILAWRATFWWVSL